MCTVPLKLGLFVNRLDVLSYLKGPFSELLVLSWKIFNSDNFLHFPGSKSKLLNRERSIENVFNSNEKSNDIPFTLHKTKLLRVPLWIRPTTLETVSHLKSPLQSLSNFFTFFIFWTLPYCTLPPLSFFIFSISPYFVTCQRNL